MEHAYNSGRMRTHSHQIQLDGGEKSTKKSCTDIHQSFKSARSLLKSPAMSLRNTMLSQVWHLTERFVFLNPAVDQSG